MTNHFSLLALRTPRTLWKGKKIWHWKMGSPGWRVSNMPLESSRDSSRRNEEAEPKLKQCPAVDVSDGESQVWCCKEHYIGTWNVRSMLLVLLLSCFSCAQLYATPQTAAHHTLPSLGVSRQEHWSGLPFPSPMHERKSESEVAQSCPTLSDPMDCSLPSSSIHGIFQAKEYWSGVPLPSPVRSMNQDKLEAVKQEIARVNINLLGISKLKWTGMGKFNSDDHYIYYCGQESPRRNGEALAVNKSSTCSTGV